MTMDVDVYADTLTFECWTDILQIHYEKDERTGGKAKESKVKLYRQVTFEWKIDQFLLSELKQSNVGQLFCSQNCGHFWFQLMPNGYTVDTKGKMKLYLESIGILPSGLRSIKLKYSLLCRETKFKKEDVIRIKKKGGYSAVANFNFGKRKQLKKHKSITLECHLSVESAHDLKKKEIEPKHWRKYGILPSHLCLKQGLGPGPNEQEEQQQEDTAEHIKNIKNIKQTKSRNKNKNKDKNKCKQSEDADVAAMTMNGDRSMQEREGTDSKSMIVDILNEDGSVMVMEHEEQEEVEADRKEKETDKLQNGDIHKLMPWMIARGNSLYSHSIDDRDNDDLDDLDMNDEDMSSINNNVDESAEHIPFETKTLKSRKSNESNWKQNQMDSGTFTVGMTEEKEEGTEEEHDDDGGTEPQQEPEQKEEESEEEEPPIKPPKFKVDIVSFDSIIDDDGVDVDDDDVDVDEEDEEEEEEEHDESTEHTLNAENVQLPVRDDVVLKVDNQRRNTLEFVHDNDEDIDGKLEDKDSVNLEVDGADDGNDNDNDNEDEDDRQSVGRFTIEAARSASILSISDAADIDIVPSPKNVDLNGNSENARNPNQTQNQNQPPSLMESFSSNNPTPREFGQSLVSPMTPSAGHIGRFLVSRNSGAGAISADSAEMRESIERMEAMERRFDSLQSTVKDLRCSQESEIMKWVQQFDGVTQRVQALQESMEQIKVTQYNILSQLKENGVDDTKYDDEHHALRAWLCDGLHLEEYYDVFVEEGFEDISLLCYLDEDDLIKLKVNKMAHRKKLLNAIKILKRSFAPNETYFIFNGHDDAEHIEDGHIAPHDHERNEQEMHIIDELEHDEFGANHHAYVE